MPVYKFNENFQWDTINILPYKEDASPFKSIVRHKLFAGNKDIPCDFRYFEIADGGYSTLEKHQHIHVVMIIRGKGKALIGDKILPLSEFDVIEIPSDTWHQFRPDNGETFGFLCLVNSERDKPHLPDAAELRTLKNDSEISLFIRA